MDVVKRALKRVKPVRDVGRALKARGWLPWNPLVPEDALAECVKHAVSKLREREPLEAFGDYFEFGVSRGTSLACVYHALAQARLTQSRLIGFDSFQGLPPESDQEGWDAGGCHSTLAATRQYLTGKGVDLEKVVLVEGWFKDTLTPKTRAELKLGKASLIMFDCVIHSASKEALAFCEPHIEDRAVLIFDDWEPALHMGVAGQKEVFEEFLFAHPELRAEPLPSYNEDARVFLVSREERALT
jgi:O-methyltransferase